MVDGQVPSREAAGGEAAGVQWGRAILFVLGWVAYFAALAAAFPLGRMIGRAFPLAGP